MIAALPQTATAADLIDQEMVKSLARVFVNCGGLAYAGDFADAGFDSTDYLKQRKWIGEINPRGQFPPRGEVLTAYREQVGGF